MNSGKREWKGMQVWASDGDVAQKTSTKALVATMVIVLAFVCTGAGYGIAHVSAGAWPSSTERALELLADDEASSEQRRDAIFVLHRNEVLIRDALLREAAASGPASKHAQVAAQKAREGWAR
jgi:hypothetical protein